MGNRVRQVAGRSKLWRLTCLVLSILTCFSLLGCNLAASQSSAGADLYPINYNSRGRVSSISLVQALVAGINGEATAKSIFDNLSSRQVQGLDRDEFSRYILALKPKDLLRVRSFNRVEEVEEGRLKREIEQRMPLLMDGAERSIFFELNYLTVDRDESSLIVGLQLSDDGDPYFDPDWVRAILRLNDFSTLYFAAIDAIDLDALTWLLANGRQDFSGGNPTKLGKLKAKNLFEYYQIKVIGPAAASVCNNILPGKAVYHQKYRLNALAVGERELEISEDQGSLTVHEKINQQLEDDDGVLFIYGERVMPPNHSGSLNMYKSSELSSKIGPLRRVRHENPDNPKEFKAEYSGLVFTVVGEYDHAAKEWLGEITEIVVSSSRYSFGQDIKVGMPAYDFFLKYPFTPESNYTVRAPFLRGEIALITQIEADKIARIVWQYH